MTAKTVQPPASDRLAAEEMRGAESTNHEVVGLSFSHGASAAAVGQLGETPLGAAGSGFTGCRSRRLSELLDAIDVDGWDSASGRECLEVIQQVCRQEATRWTGTAGRLEDEGVAPTWEAVERWRCARTVHDPMAVLRTAARRAYVAEAASVQLGTGDPVHDRRKLSKSLRDATCRSGGARTFRSDVDLSLRAGHDVDLSPGTGRDDLDHHRPPAWMVVTAAVLVEAGWSWPQAPGQCLRAVVMDAERTGRREAVPVEWERTGVPRATWSALGLLACGSGPGCAPESRWPGTREIHREGGARAVRESVEVRRVATAAVAGRPVRSGRVAVRGTRTALGGAA